MKYAGYDPSERPSPVRGWYDSDAIPIDRYRDPPPALLELTEDEWGTRLSCHWAVLDGQLIPHTPEPLKEPPPRGVIDPGAFAAIMAMRKAADVTPPPDVVSELKAQMKEMAARIKALGG
jgi:hypothetical protein